MSTLTPEAQKGLDYLKTANPTLASSISNSFTQNTAPIDVGAVTNSPKLTIPPYTPPPVPVIPQITNTPVQNQLDSAATDLTNTIAADTAKLGTKADRQTQLEAGAGLPAMNQQLTELTSRIKALQNDSAAIPLQIQNDFAGRGATAAGVQPIQDAALRRNAIKALGLSAAAEAVQGNIALANDHVTKALAAEFDPITAEIDAKKTLLAANRDSFNTEEKRRAEELSIQLDQQKQAAQDAKDSKKQVYDIMLAAAKNGADNVTLNNIQRAATPEAAIAAAGSVLNTPDTMTVDANGHVLLIDKATGKTLANLGTSDAALAAAQRAATTATKPPTQTQITYGNYAPRLQTSDQTINQLTPIITKIQPVAFSIANRLPSWLQSSEIQQYNQAKANFVSAVLRQESGAAISDSERAAYEKQYFPVPGDSAATIAQKAQNRAQVVQSYVKNAGAAYTGPANDPYADYRTQLQQGEILVQRGAQLIAITPDELQAGDQQL